MNILHLIDEPYDSGIVQYALKAAAGLRDRGHKSHVWGLAGCFPVLEAHRLGLDTFGYWHPWLNLPSMRSRVRETKIDLLVAHTGSSHTLGVAVAGWRGPRHLPVLRVRGDSRRMKPRPGRRLLWRHTAGFIAANKMILADHQRSLASAAVTSAMIYEGSPDPGPVRPPTGGVPTVGIVGRLDPVKGHTFFIEAAALLLQRFPDVRFLIIGRQENVSSGDLLRQAHGLGIAERIELTGHVPSVIDYMRRCHIGTVASIGSEAVSRAAVEWMAAGRPLVATRVGCLPEYVAEGRTGRLVLPRAPRAMAEALGDMVADSLLRETYGRAARERYDEMFTLDRFLDETERFYENALHTVPS